MLYTKSSKRSTADPVVALRNVESVPTTSKSRMINLSKITHGSRTAPSMDKELMMKGRGPARKIANKCFVATPLVVSALLPIQQKKAYVDNTPKGKGPSSVFPSPEILTSRMKRKQAANNIPSPSSSLSIPATPAAKSPVIQKTTQPPTNKSATPRTPSPVNQKITEPPTNRTVTASTPKSLAPPSTNLSSTLSTLAVNTPSPKETTALPSTSAATSPSPSKRKLSSSPLPPSKRQHRDDITPPSSPSPSPSTSPITPSSSVNTEINWKSMFGEDGASLGISWEADDSALLESQPLTDLENHFIEEVMGL